MARESVPAFLMLLLVLFGACRSPEPETRAESDSPLYDRLDPDSRQLAESTLQSTLESQPSDATARWQSAGNSTSGSITPLRTFRIKTGHFCREFRETVERDGEWVARIEIACRNQNGGWVVVPRRDRQD